ncbi:hypothetical protein Q5P01_010571 [Channa striata]|uniref:Uncharacterized protein n=1 Tax=Channa striata TaxID=64152 RepID=A0AA88SYH2_CHASR|nr:hypothetical protein Q5P01_010571 [Channa striata]
MSKKPEREKSSTKQQHSSDGVRLLNPQKRQWQRCSRANQELEHSSAKQRHEPSPVRLTRSAVTENARKVSVEDGGAARTLALDSVEIFRPTDPSLLRRIRIIRPHGVGD